MHPAFRGSVLAVAMAAAMSVAAQQPPSPDDSAVYILVLESSDKARPGEAPEKREPDVEKHGGKLLGVQGNRRFVRLPRKASRALCAEKGVAYLQRVWEGEPLDGVREQPCGSARGDLAANQVEEDLTWTTGTYAYDGAGKIKSIGNDTYSYDSAGRLISATVKGVTERYRYDSFGNLTEKGIVGQTPATIRVDSSSNRLAGETYDVAGNVTTGSVRRYTYDSVGMMDAAHETWGAIRYIYTADDERIATFRDESTYRYTIRDFDGKVMREFSAYTLTSQERWLWVQDTVFAGGQLIGSERELALSGRRHHHLDHLGSVRMLTNDAGLRLGLHDYYPFGVEQTSTAQEVTNFGYERPEALKFTGHERDFRWYNAEHVDYLDYMHARYYDANVGRFLSVDPILGNALEPQSWNRYAYVLNNPANLVDPYGMRPAAPFTASEIITVEGVDPTKDAVRRIQIEQSSMWLAFLRSISGYNYAKGAYTYGRGLVRAAIHQSRRDGYLGEEEAAAAAADQRKLQELHALLARCIADTTCRNRLTKVLNSAYASIPAHQRSEIGQVAAGRLLTGVGVGYLFSRIGLYPVGPMAAFSAATGDELHYVRDAGPTLDALIGLLHAAATGGR